MSHLLNKSHTRGESRQDEWDHVMAIIRMWVTITIGISTKKKNVRCNLDQCC